MRILVTGFSSFPGARKNPTATLVRALGTQRARLARLGITLQLSVLPVDYVKVARKLGELDDTLRPDAILHFGLATRRRTLSVETRALNRLSLLRYDASGTRAKRQSIIAGGPRALRSIFPARQIEAEFQRAGLRARLSINAGSYVCNETLYLSLARSQARAIGFIHVPPLACARRLSRAKKTRRPDLHGLTRAALIAILLIASKLRQEDLRTPLMR